MFEKRPLAQHSMAVVGIRHLNSNGSNRLSEVLMCCPGEPVELRPELKNPFDHLAIAVFSARGVQLGYLPADRCARMRQIMGQGHEVTAVFQQAGSHNAWIRVAYDGDVPRLPAMVSSEADGVHHCDETEWAMEMSAALKTIRGDHE